VLGGATSELLGAVLVSSSLGGGRDGDCPVELFIFVVSEGFSSFAIFTLVNCGAGGTESAQFRTLVEPEDFRDINVDGGLESFDGRIVRDRKVDCESSVD
jgi:hypothetical protein